MRSMARAVRHSTLQGVGTVHRHGNPLEGLLGSLGGSSPFGQIGISVDLNGLLGDSSPSTRTSVLTRGRSLKSYSVRDEHGQRHNVVVREHGGVDHTIQIVNSGESPQIAVVGFNGLNVVTGKPLSRWDEGLFVSPTSTLDIAVDHEGKPLRFKDAPAPSESGPSPYVICLTVYEIGVKDPEQERQEATLRYMSGDRSRAHKTLVDGHKIFDDRLPTGAVLTVRDTFVRPGAASTVYRLMPRDQLTEMLARSGEPFDGLYERRPSKDEQFFAASAYPADNASFDPAKYREERRSEANNRGTSCQDPNCRRHGHAATVGSVAGFGEDGRSAW